MGGEHRDRVRREVDGRERSTGLHLLEQHRSDGLARRQVGGGGDGLRQGRPGIPCHGHITDGRARPVDAGRGPPFCGPASQDPAPAPRVPKQGPLEVAHSRRRHDDRTGPCGTITAGARLVGADERVEPVPGRRAHRFLDLKRDRPRGHGFPLRPDEFDDVVVVLLDGQAPRAHPRLRIPLELDSRPARRGEPGLADARCPVHDEVVLAHARDPDDLLKPTASARGGVPERAPYPGESRAAKVPRETTRTDAER